jgi:hypothetical protein
VGHIRKDLYSPKTSHNGAITLWDRAALGPGPHTLTMTMDSKNPSSAHFMFGLDWIKFVRIE